MLAGFEWNGESTFVKSQVVLVWFLPVRFPRLFWKFRGFEQAIWVVTSSLQIKTAPLKVAFTFMIRVTLLRKFQNSDHEPTVL